MPLSLTDTRVETLIHLLYVKPGGLSVREMAAHFDPAMPPRSAQRWLAGLVSAGLLARKGKGRATRYLAPTERRGRKPRLAPPGRVLPGAAPLPPVSETRRADPASAAASTSPARPGTSPTTPRSAATSPASAVSEPPKAATASSERVPERLTRLLGELVSGQIIPERLREEVSMKKDMGLRPGEPLDEFTAAVTAALDRMTMDDAVRAGISPAAFMEWREIYWPAMVVTAPPAPSKAPRPPLPPTPSISAERARYLFGYVPDLIRDRVTPAMLRAWLTKRAPMAMRGAETLEDWVTLMNAELCRLRLEDAVALNVPPDRYRLWRKTIWPA